MVVKIDALLLGTLVAVVILQQEDLYIKTDSPFPPLSILTVYTVGQNIRASLTDCYHVNSYTRGFDVCDDVCLC